MRRVVATALACAPLACSTPKWEATTWELLAHRVPETNGSVPTMYWVRTEDGKPQPTTPGLAGFEPRWGVEYRVEVLFRETTSGVFGDSAGMPMRQFGRIISEKPTPNTEFTIESMGAPWLGADRRTFVDGQSFSCEPAVCEKLDDLAADDDARFETKLRHGATPGQLALIDVTEQ